MIVIVGIVFIAASVGALWRLLPSEGRLHPLATAPVLESVIPICIVGGFAIGMALIFAGLTVG